MFHAVWPVPEGAADIRFQLNKVVVEGSTIYPDSVLEAQWASLLNREVSLAELYRLADNLTLIFGYQKLIARKGTNLNEDPSVII